MSKFDATLKLPKSNFLPQKKSPTFSFEKLKEKLKIDDTFTKTVKKEKKQTKISDAVTLLENYNFMADVLHLPTTKQGYKYLVVLVDLATREFDIEPMKNKEAKEALTAIKSMFKRKYIKQPKASLRTDNGTEFQGVFDKFLKDNKIFHSVSMPSNHSQLSMVESLNRTLGILFIGYLNQKEKETRKQYREWTDVIDIIRKELNKIRYTKPPYTEKTIFDYKDKPVNMKEEPKYKIGNLVHYKLSYPTDILGNPQPTAQFRTGDARWSVVPKKIEHIYYYSGAIPYRYGLENMPYVSFTEAELMPSNETEPKWIVKKIIGKKTIKKKIHYLVWFKGYLKKDATWEPKTELLKDGLDEYIQEFEDKEKLKKKKKAQPKSKG